METYYAMFLNLAQSPSLLVARVASRPLLSRLLAPLPCAPSATLKLVLLTTLISSTRRPFLDSLGMSLLFSCYSLAVADML